MSGAGTESKMKGGRNWMIEEKESKKKNTKKRYKREIMNRLREKE